jgi:putative FmdB family regulatory protein
MPTYEYQCKECAEKFERIEHTEEHDASKPTCPKCGSKKVDQILGTFFAKTARKS